MDIRSRSFSDKPHSFSRDERMVVNDKLVPFSTPLSVVETILTNPSGKDNLSSRTATTADPTKSSVSVNGEGCSTSSFIDDSPVTSREGGTPCPDSSGTAQITDEQKALYLKPLLAGWRREVAVRNNQASANADVYFFAPDGTKLRSKLEIARYMLEKGIVADYTADQNFSFIRRELGGEFAPYETVRLNRLGRHSKYDSKGGTPKRKSSPSLEKSSCNAKNLEDPSPAAKTSSKKNDAPDTINLIKEKKAKKKKKKKKKERYYCICSGNYVGNMVSCDNPKCVIGWYHHDCVKVTERPKRAWYCPICRGVDSQTLLTTYAAEQNLI